MAQARPRFLVVSDDPHACAYLPGRTARTPLRLPLAPVTPEQFDRLLEEGDRRAGPLLYRTRCPRCTACEALRVPVARFQPTKSQRRAWRRNEGEVRVEVGAPRVTDRHVELYNRHRDERGLSRGDGSINIDEYRRYYVDSCADTREVRYLVDGRLVAVSVLDVGRRSVSSVYHFFDPDESRRSLGVYSVLKELEWCAAQGYEWYYLGLWVRDCPSLAYKSQYYPHERRIRGAWQGFDAPAKDEP